MNKCFTQFKMQKFSYDSFLGGTSYAIDYVDEDKENTSGSLEEDEVPLEYKRKALKIYDEHKGKWKFSTFQNRFPKLKHKSYIPKWRKQVTNGNCFINCNEMITITALQYYLHFYFYDI